MMYVMQHFGHLKIQLEAIKFTTNDFAEENCIGRGGFGKVYRGELVLPTGPRMVALKRLDSVFGQGDPEFWKEIIMLSRYKHENIVSLLGFCNDHGEKILVYEYASKKSLDLYLNNDDLRWIRRLEICIGAARGLAYLHNSNGSQQRVLHRDVKSSNILLDENWNARISDFGLSKFGPANQQHSFLFSNVVGTHGYCDPVYVETGLLTKESDVYSFGVVLFEVLCGRLCHGNHHNNHPPLIGLVRKCYEERKINEIIYANIKDEINPNSLKSFITIAYHCLNRDPKMRPLMANVVKELETSLNYQRTPSFQVTTPTFSVFSALSALAVASPSASASWSSMSGLDLFSTAKSVRFKSYHKMYLYAEEDEESVSQDLNRSSKNNHWTIEHITSDSDNNNNNTSIRLKSCYNKYLTASNDPFLPGTSGRKVIQTLPRQLDSSVEWELIRTGKYVKLRTPDGNYLRANSGIPPWSNNVTHDAEALHPTTTGWWVLWDVDVVDDLMPDVMPGVMSTTTRLPF